MTLQDFIDKWQPSGGAERANFPGFIHDLCDVLGVPKPEPTVDVYADNAYVFEKDVTFHHVDGTTSNRRIDLYKRGCFVMEAKQGTDKQGTDRDAGQTSEQALLHQPKKRKKGTALRDTAAWDAAMKNAYEQADKYARALPASEGRPPFIIVVDIGYSFEIYAEFSRTGGTYVAFPDPQNHRFFLDELAEKRELLRTIWTDPLSLDPARHSAKVTKEIATNLAALARSLETGGGSAAQRTQPPETVAAFLMRCIFTMFAEDVGLLPKRSFLTLLESFRDDPKVAPDMLSTLWHKMDSGGFSPVLRADVLRFNGGLFSDASALPLTRVQLEHLITAARADWRAVEPAIFGTLLERALSPIERHKLGAHYTPRAYVERLVIPTVIDPLRSRWQAVQASLLKLMRDAKTEDAGRQAAIAAVRDFHAELCRVRILDPACGSGNFLYVTLELLKRLEGDVLDTLAQLGEQQGSFDMPSATVDPHQFLGLEVNPRAAKIAELVLWIGYLQWHFPPEAASRHPNRFCKTSTTSCAETPFSPTTTYGSSSKTANLSPVGTGAPPKSTPSPAKTSPTRAPASKNWDVLDFRSRAEWPPTDYVVGNPPFIGTAAMRQALGDGYTETLRETYDELPDSVDFVMYWWHIAADLLREGKIRRFGFVTTNSLRQTFNRRVLQMHMNDKKPLSLVFAIPDHPWVDDADGAAVRIAMTAAAAGDQMGMLQRVLSETRGDAVIDVTMTQQTGKIFADLTIGADVASAVPLEANQDISNPGVKLHGSGFIVTPEQADALGYNNIPELKNHICEYRNGRDIAGKSRNVTARRLVWVSN
ncbi:MAG: type IIL restriction-modification enzyme MmeI [Trueperaceae bacterium]|nr:type IIL restriction-modification enzyme MmeI [Trueperaceae bacterium]